MAKEIMIEFDMKDLSVKTEAFGYAGKGCQVDLDEVQELLGMKTLDHKFKAKIRESTTKVHQRRG